MTDFMSDGRITDVCEVMPSETCQPGHKMLYLFMTLIIIYPVCRNRISC